MAGTSTRTVVVGVRLPVDVAKKARENAGKRGVTVSGYLAGIVAVQVMRKR